MSERSTAYDKLYKFKIHIAIALVAVLVAAQAANVYSVSPSLTATYNQYAGVESCTYKIFTDGTYYYGQSCDTSAIGYGGPSNAGGAVGTNIASVTQATLNGMTSGGKLLFKSGLYMFSSGVTAYITSTVYYEIAGEGTATQWNFTGSGYLFTLNGTASSIKQFYMHDLGMSGVSKTSGRNGIKDLASGPMAYYQRLRLDNFDVGINIIDTNSRTYDGLRIFTTNVAIETNAGSTSQPNAINIRDFSISDAATVGIIHNIDTQSGVSLSIENGVIDTSAVGINISGSGSNVHIKDVYFEDNTNKDVYIKGFDNTHRIDSVLMENLRGQGHSSTPYMIQVDYANKVTIENMAAFNYVNASIVVGINTTQQLLVINPYLEGTSYLIDSSVTLTTADARVVGRVIENARTGVIVTASTAGLVAGDVVVPGGANIFASTTTANDSIPKIVIYGNTGANRPVVLCDAGITQVNVNGAATLKDTWTTSTTTKQAQINNAQTDPKKVGGFITQTTGGAGLAYSTCG